MRSLGTGRAAVGNPAGRCLVLAAPLLLAVPAVPLGVVLHVRRGAPGSAVGGIPAGRRRSRRSS